MEFEIELGDDVLDDDLVKLSETAENNLVQDNCSTVAKKGPGVEHMEVLSKYFGHTSFRPMQWEIISAILEDRRDVCAIMFTGYGKSLCFQFPSVFTGGITLVVSPLIALMEDQVLSLKIANIPACLLGTAQKDPVQVIDDIFQHKYSVVYLTPEFCTGEFGSGILRRMSTELNVTLIAVDEAHCISSWGHDFRYQYRKLDCFHYMFPSVPIMAVTATATKRVRDDIIENLRLRNPLLLCSGFDRPNLYFEVYPKGERNDKAIFQDLCKTMVYKNSVWKFSGPTIVYCISRNQTEQVSDILRRNGINSRPYHAGLSLKVRKETHEQFVRDQIDVVVATIAFGMGIDKPDITNIIHYGASKSIENYYQEVGRAGRDGNPARCVAFYSDFDFWLLRKIDERSGNRNQEQKEANLHLMEEFLNNRHCRRRFILSYFGDDSNCSDEPEANCCDNCTRRRYDRRTDHEKYEELDENGSFNFTNDVKILLETISSVGVGLGITTYIAIMRGSQQSRVTSYEDHPMFGTGKHRTIPWWKAVAQILIDEKYLEDVPQETYLYSYISYTLTSKGTTLLNDINRNGATFLRTPPPAVIKELKKKSRKTPVKSNRPSTSKSVDPISPDEIEQKMKIYQELVNKRSELAACLDCMPYMVITNTALNTIAAAKPRSLDEMRCLNLDGLTEAKLKKFGEEFIKVVKSMTNRFGQSNCSYEKKQSIKDILYTYPLSNVSPLNFSAGVTCALYQSGLNVEDISVKRKLGKGTVISHLIAGIKNGYPVKMADLGVTKEYRDIILNIFKRRSSPSEGFLDVTPLLIKNDCPMEITMDHIKTVLTYLQVRYHLKNLNLPYEEFESFKFDEITSFKADMSMSDANKCNLVTLIENKENLEVTDLTEVTENSMGEPPVKKEKFNICWDHNYHKILDSPPHTVVSGDDLVVSQEVEIVEEQLPNNLTIPVTTVKKKSKASKKKILPPWLVTRKIN